eukprot:CAMPEP_0197900252 /NCGR_PEP_ID=MMETSP1439-20131203/48669_1 /TAXON_ID=66791 /ORGANISM="Gonyaulax spinifera, Strain CCMP409" /LENGTH=157 /DNA_ID=CAMNT_0043521121 /DNA_START=103 /DNA_END=576 /DNA_ORIENTATION=+
MSTETASACSHDHIYCRGNSLEALIDIVGSIPRTEAGDFTSVGSMLHRTGGCKPCASWFKNICSNGVLCKDCHFVHEGQLRKRLRPPKRLRNLPVDGHAKEANLFDAHVVALSTTPAGTRIATPNGGKEMQVTLGWDPDRAAEIMQRILERGDTLFL